MSKQLQIRNSTAEFLIFQAEDKSQGVQVFYQDENIWATQKAMAELYGVDRSVITKHLKNIFESLELQQDAVSEIFAHTALDGKTYNTQFYNQDEPTICRKFRYMGSTWNKKWYVVNSDKPLNIADIVV